MTAKRAGNRWLPCLLLTASIGSCSGNPKPKPPTRQAPVEPSIAELAQLEEDERVRGFRTRALYLDDDDEAMGARFVHERTGFVFDYLRIESAPQGLIWVNSFPTSDQGEPHTQEHLLLGKGQKGRFVSSLESMSLVESSAFTMQWRTVYTFHTVAGAEVFWNVLGHRFDALLHPDYTDEEIRREVRNFGVAAEPDGSLRLEEKGTVYNEMVRSYESPWRRVFRVVGHALYGPEHPLALSSGGLPAAIREMTPQDIRRFHRANYHLGNMGMIGAFPPSQALDEVLRQMNATLDRAREDEGREGSSEDDLPPPAPGPEAGAIEVVGVPHSNPRQPGPVVLAWPATRDLAPDDRLLLELFLSAFAGDESTNLYERFIDSETRTSDLGASDVWSSVSSDLGYPVHIGFSNVSTAAMTPGRLDSLRTDVRDELSRIAEADADAAVVKALDDRVRSRLVERRREVTKFLNSPPQFGHRGVGSGWLRYLHELSRTTGFRRSLTMKPQLDHVERQLERDGNIWRERLRAWGLLDASPTVVAGKASPALLERVERQRRERIAAKREDLKERYRTEDASEALARYRADYDAATRRLEEAEASMEMPGFIDSPPMTLDDTLDYRVETSAGVQNVVSTFDNMTSAEVGIAFRVDTVPEAQLPYLALLPVLITDVGLFEDGVALPYARMKEQLREQILDLSVYYTTNWSTGRVELMVTGSGNDAAETRRALRWMRRALLRADWRPDNLPRIRDVVDQAVARLRNRMSGAEEGWVEDPASSYWRQDRPVLLHTDSFLTREHDAHRLRWQLRSAEGAEGAVAYLERLASASDDAGREELIALASALQEEPGDRDPVPGDLRDRVAAFDRLSPPARELIRDAAEDLSQLVVSLPDGSLARDWAYLCRQMAADLEVAPARALADLTAVRDAILRRDGARMYTVGARDTQRAIAEEQTSLLTAIPDSTVDEQSYSSRRLIDERLRGRVPDASDPVFVGLVNPNTQSGVFVNHAPGFGYDDRDEDVLLDYLASNLFTGAGAHGVFMKTWAAGLAYSNGMRGSLATGRIQYYAERCPRLPQTLGFVIDHLREAEPEPHLADYAIAQSFHARVASSYEGRAAAMAANLADGITPELVRGFRERLLALRSRPGLTSVLFERMPSVYGRVLPGYGPASASVDDAVYFVIGPETQLDHYAAYLERAEGPDASLYRLYPRDFWVPAPRD